MLIKSQLISSSIEPALRKSITSLAVPRVRHYSRDVVDVVMYAQINIGEATKTE